MSHFSRFGVYVFLWIICAFFCKISTVFARDVPESWPIFSYSAGRDAGFSAGRIICNASDACVTLT